MGTLNCIKVPVIQLWYSVIVFLILLILFSGLKADLIERLYNFKVEVILIFRTEELNNLLYYSTSIYDK